MRVGTSVGSTDDKPAFHPELNGLDERREERAKKHISQRRNFSKKKPREIRRDHLNFENFKNILNYLTLQKNPCKLLVQENSNSFSDEQYKKN